jgi:ABC-type antimicrobial peptide transport system permease subunit
MAVAGVLACGVFLTIAIGANRKSPLSEPLSRGSGTGGFAFFGESAIGISTDLNAESVRGSLGLDREVLKDVRIVQMRVHEGDDASCLNLNRAQSPQILGVSVEQFRSRGAFSFTYLVKGADPKSAWNVLAQQPGEDVVPAVGDYPTVYWGLGKRIGDEIPFTDEMGRQLRLRIVGMLKSSIMQGSLLISEEQFVRVFPSEDGYRVFLVDAPPDRAEQVAEQLSSRLQDFGLSVTPTVERIAAFSAVENSYLSVFQLLGGLALTVGSIGLALVVLRNMLERRGELAMLRAVGFGSRAITKMVLYEHSALVLYGLACGTVAALIAISPALGVPSAGVPYVSIGLTIAAIAGGGVLWIWLATALALRSNILEALRNE